MDSHTHNLTVAYCNIQGGLIYGISLSTEITKLIRKYDIDVLSLNEINLGKIRNENTKLKEERQELNNALSECETYRDILLSEKQDSQQEIKYKLAKT